MKKILLATCTMFLICASIAVACDDNKVSKLAGVAIDRCMEQKITLSFDTPGKRDRAFITINREDGRELYEALRHRYEKTKR
jgi:hypothetical protein